MLATVLSLMVLAIFVLVAGSIYLLRRGGARKQALLMLLVAAVLAGNLALWTVPGADGGSPAQSMLK